MPFRHRGNSPEELQAQLDRDWELDGLLAVKCGAWGGDIPAEGWSDRPVDPETVDRILGYFANRED